MPERFDVFLCHNSRDKLAVIALGEALKAKQYRPWLDVWDLPPGVSWQEELETILETVPAVAVLIGKDGLGPWQVREMRAGLEEFVRRGARVVPVLLPGAAKQPKLPLFLRSLNYLDLRGGMSSEGLDRLIWGITGKRPEPGRLTSEIQPPKLHNLPFVSLGPLFQGRDNDLAQLRRDFGTTSATALVQPQAISGLGGIGKTRLAVELAWRSGARFSTVLFVTADSPQNLRSGLARLAQPDLLHLGVEGEAEDRVIAEVLHWLRESTGWLLILDNVDTADAQQAVRELLTLSSGRVVVTSRLATWPRGIHRYGLETLERAASVRLLLEATDGSRISSGDDENLAGRVAERLGDLPLALEQAAAYIAARGIGFTTYLRDWERDQPNVLAWYDQAATDYPFSVAMTWNQTVGGLGPSARALLRLLAHMAPEPVPIAMLETATAIVSEGAELVAQEDDVSEPEATDVLAALAELARFTLVTRQETLVSVHRLVQEVVRSRIPAQSRAAWAERAVRLVNDFAPETPSDVRTWTAWDPLRPHAMRVTELAEAENVEQPTSTLLNQLAVLLWAKGLFPQAEPLMQRALAIDERASGNDHPDIARDLNNLAQLLQVTNRLAEAEPVMRRALDIDERAFGNEHPRVAIDLNNLAGLLLATNRLTEAEPLMRRALTIDERAFGNEHPNVATDLSNLAGLLKATDRLDEAEPLMRRALTIDKRSFGNDHPNVAKDLNNLARLFQDTNRLDEAEPLMRRALTIDEHAFGNDHPNVARDLNNLAGLLEATNRLDEAEPLMRRALDILTRSLGEDHPKTQIVTGNLAHLLQDLASRPAE